MGRLQTFGFLGGVGVLAAGIVAPPPSFGHPRAPLEAGGALVAVSVSVDGCLAELLPAPDGSDRYYLEARKGARYAVQLQNRTAERVGVVLTVDGLNAISGERDPGRGRMYVLDPWGAATVQGWRTSLRDVRQFTFVDEERSYATRSGKANARMGWIEVTVYREKGRRVWPYVREEGARDRASAPAAPAPVEGSARPRSAAPSEPAADAAVGENRSASREGAPSYPGTGWGPRAHDPVVLVSFDPEDSAAERVTLRYEYRPALLALGVLPYPRRHDERLWERERGEPGFATPPSW
jgi:hypothetical protein